MFAPEWGLRLGCHLGAQREGYLSVEPTGREGDSPESIT